MIHACVEIYRRVEEPAYISHIYIHTQETIKRIKEPARTTGLTTNGSLRKEWLDYQLGPYAETVKRCVKILTECVYIYTQSGWTISLGRIKRSVELRFSQNGDYKYVICIYIYNG
jgi:hypothetical protein